MLTSILYFLLATEGQGRAKAAAGFLSLGVLSWILLAWTRCVIFVPDVFPSELGVAQNIALQVGGLLLAIAGFSIAGGPRRALAGGVFGLSMGMIAWSASRWLQLSRALDLCGATFVGPLLGKSVAPAFVLTAVIFAAALLLKDLKPYAGLFLLSGLALWAVPTLTVKTILARRWGLGPRTLAEAAHVQTDAGAASFSVLRFAPNSGVVSRENVRMASSLQDVRPNEPLSTGVDLSPASIARLEDFLRRSSYRGVFAQEALAHVRRGWLMHWDSERALNAMIFSVPGRLPADYRGALDLIKIGPMTAQRFAKLRRLDALATADPRKGFEQVTESQRIFEGFAAAYARFGDEAQARRWLGRLDNLLLVADKSIEVAPLEDFRSGQVSGSLIIGRRPARSVKVGLFEIWRTTPTAAGHRLLSVSTFPDVKGRFMFSNLGPGEYEIGLMGPRAVLRGRVRRSPGRFEIDSDHPRIVIPPILIERVVDSSAQVLLPEDSAQTPVPEASQPPLFWRKR